jgi:adenosylcobinamide kinase/adenosylcobinamide-phosphate guanylyltransferase
LSGAPGPVLLVANEVGLGIVPDNAMSRRFRDWAGSLNQRMARCAREVILTVAGIPIPIKSLTKANLQEDE